MDRQVWGKLWLCLLTLILIKSQATGCKATTKKPVASAPLGEVRREFRGQCGSGDAGGAVFVAREAFDKRCDSGDSASCKIAYTIDPAYRNSKLFTENLQRINDKLNQIESQLTQIQSGIDEINQNLDELPYKAQILAAESFIGDGWKK